MRPGAYRCRRGGLVAFFGVALWLEFWPAVLRAATCRWWQPPPTFNTRCRRSRVFSRATGRSVKLSFGSSGNLSRQITQGAPFEVFFSADESYVRELASVG